MAIAIYARKSVERENSISCETQIEYCKATIKPDERNEKVLTFVDNGFSGGNIDRDGFQKMMKAVPVHVSIMMKREIMFLQLHLMKVEIGFLTPRVTLLASQSMMTMALL
jgi:hypothetical protein